MIDEKKLADLRLSEYTDDWPTEEILDTIQVLWKVARAAGPVVDDYEKYVDNHHDDTCGDYPTCVHTAKWDAARLLKVALAVLRPPAA